MRDLIKILIEAQEVPLDDLPGNLVPDDDLPDPPAPTPQSPAPTPGLKPYPVGKAAVQAFQASHKDQEGNPLEKDGYIGVKTAWALKQAGYSVPAQLVGYKKHPASQAASPTTSTSRPAVPKTPAPQTVPVTDPRAFQPVRQPMNLAENSVEFQNEDLTRIVSLVHYR